MHVCVCVCVCKSVTAVSDDVSECWCMLRKSDPLGKTGCVGPVCIASVMWVIVCVSESADIV